VVQYGNTQYTNIVVKMEKKSNFCLLKVAIVGGRLRLRPQAKFFEGRVPRLPYNRRHGVENMIRVLDSFIKRPSFLMNVANYFLDIRFHFSTSARIYS